MAHRDPGVRTFETPAEWREFVAAIVAAARLGGHGHREQFVRFIRTIDIEGEHHVVQVGDHTIELDEPRWQELTHEVRAAFWH